MIPITKNIIVSDEFGKEYEPSYLRRANGLIKNGRARWVDNSHTKICLTCPPQFEVEDNNMDNSIVDKVNEKESIIHNKPQQLNMEYILSRIDQIISDNKHIHEALKALNEMPLSEPYDTAGSSKSDAIGTVVSSREVTNQQLINVLVKMYDDIKPKEADIETQKLINIGEFLRQIRVDEYSPEILELLKKTTQQMFVKAGAEVV